jgi:hypothetical protein
VDICACIGKVVDTVGTPKVIDERLKINHVLFYTKKTPLDLSSMAEKK